MSRSLRRACARSARGRSRYAVARTAPEVVGNDAGALGKSAQALDFGRNDLGCARCGATIAAQGYGQASWTTQEHRNVGRRTRTISPGLRRVLNARDQGCRFPGCCNQRHVDAHHIHHWADGGETKPSNLLSLCRWHHRCVHEGGIQIRVLDDGALRFVRPDGNAVDSVAAGYTQPLGDWRYLPTQNVERGMSIDARTAATRWGGGGRVWIMGWRWKCCCRRRGSGVRVGWSKGAL